MTADENKALVRRFITEIFEQGRVEAVEELCADDFIGHTWGNADRAGLKATMARVATALADAHFQVDDMIAEDDRVAVRVTATARQVGEFMGLPRERAELHDRGDPHLPGARRQGQRALARVRPDRPDPAADPSGVGARERSVIGFLPARLRLPCPCGPMLRPCSIHTTHVTPTDSTTRTTCQAAP